MSKIRQKLSGFARHRRALLPTPVHELTSLSEAYGVRVFCKRDDLTGFGLGGNKARKLDFLITEAEAGGFDALIAVGANQSNFCRMAAAYGSASRMNVHLILGGTRPTTPTGNLRLDLLLEATCHHIDSADWSTWEEAAERIAADLASRGQRVYRLPVGGSTPRGTLGYVEALSEVLDNEQQLGVCFDAIVHASSSAGTQAGLLVGQAISEWPGRILGISVAKDASTLRQDVLALASETAKMLGASIDARDVHVDDAFVGQGYAIPTPESHQALRTFAQQFGIFLDSVYTSKAAAALLSYLEAGRFEGDRAVLFVHTGGTPELLS